MQQAQGQTQDAQNALQSEYPANEEAGYKETQGRATDDSANNIKDESWRPSDDPAIEQAGGTTRSSEEEPGRSQQDGKAQGVNNDTEPTHGEGAGSIGV
jgi:hypothetical protein